MMRLAVLLVLAMWARHRRHARMRFWNAPLPPVGSEIAAPPRQIVLTFTEGVEPLFSTIELRDARRIGGAHGQTAVAARQQPAACHRAAGAAGR